MGLGNRFNHVGDQFTGRQRIVHPLVAHGDAITYAGDAKEECMTAAGMHPLLDEALEIAHAGVTRDQVGKGGGNTDERLT